MKKKLPLLLGVLLGLVIPVLGIFIMLSARPELQALREFEHEVVRQVNVQLITFGMLMNAALFFVFMRFEREQIARGILASSLAVLVLIFIYSFLL